jgi:hypothetical protein
VLFVLKYINAELKKSHVEIAFKLESEAFLFKEKGQIK